MLKLENFKTVKIGKEKLSQLNGGDNVIISRSPANNRTVDYIIEEEAKP